ncbi:MAG: hypothetical protein NZ571_06305 [Anaerolineae bacterium]|nr:hypothetical protein [Anaerolineae bacterium]
MQEWHLTAESPLSMRFAADARLKRTDYTDDQSWEIAFGGSEEPSLIFQTRYGGRVNLARLVPMWIIDGRTVYTSMALAERPALRAFAPSYAKVTAKLTNALSLTSELFVFESRAAGGRFTLHNSSAEPIEVRLELAAQVMRDQKQIDMNVLSLEDGTDALHLGRAGNLNPILLLENAKAPVARFVATPQSPKLISIFSVPANGNFAIRWTHSGQISMKDSLQTAFFWLRRADWDAELRKIEQLSAETLVFETGDPDLDAALAFSQNVALRSFVNATGSLPHASFVSARIPARGWSPRGDGSDHGWQWSGQSAALAALVLPSVAAFAPELALGVLRNFLAVRQSDGFIDNKPGLGGQRAKLLSMPLLASTALALYEQTEDQTFLAEALPILRAFFLRWFAPSADHDRDGFPEWTNATHSAYTSNPLFSRLYRWSENADINKVESPDLAAYLIAEGRALLRIGELLGDSSNAEAIVSHVQRVEAHLEALWNTELGTYLYRDRDTDMTLRGVHLFRGKGDEAFAAKTQLEPPNRLILRVLGGRDIAPRFSAVIEGVDANGQHVAETLPSNAFTWYYGLGTAVTEKVYSQVNYIKFEGLIRLFNLEVDTVDLFRQNLTQLVALWSGAPSAERAAQIVATLTDPERYWRPYGLPVCPINDPAFVANNDGGSGGVWLLWNVLILEGLLRYGYLSEATELFKRILSAQIKALQRDHGFREGYNSETGEGLGDIDELAGIVPIHVFLKLIGVRIVSAHRVWAGGTFAFAQPVTVKRGGLRVTRSATSTRVEFPSGKVVETDATWQLIEDDAPRPEPTAPTPEPELQSAPVPTPISILEPTEEGIESSLMPAEGESIPVQSQRDATQEIQVNQIDFTADVETFKPAQTHTPQQNTIRIKVRDGRKRTSADDPTAE